MPLVYVFPGQGAQHVGMGDSLFDLFPALTDAADQILGYSVRELCLRNPDGKLDLTEYTQPAMYVVNALHYFDRIARGPAPDYVAGHSLGEYNALLAAGAYDFVTGLQLVQRRGHLMAETVDGAMAAVMGVGEPQLREELDRCGLHGIDVANLNSPRQIVISGPRTQVEIATAHLCDACDAHIVMLRVQTAFHSRYMAPAEHEFLAFLRTFRFESLRVPVLSNVSARPYVQYAIAETLAAQMSRPVRWMETISQLLSLDGVQFEEIGPGRTLGALIRQTARARAEEGHGHSVNPVRASARAWGVATECD